MRILGLDPGSNVTGYGTIETTGSGVTFVCGGRIRVQGTGFPERLRQIAREVEAVLARERPDVVVVEDVFSSRNVRAAFRIAQVRGVLLLKAAEAGHTVAEYSPAEIKKAVVGNGAAAKEQVQFMVKHLLGLEDLPPADEADALAAAICHSQRAGAGVKVEGGSAILEGDR